MGGGRGHSMLPMQDVLHSQAVEEPTVHLRKYLCDTEACVYVGHGLFLSRAQSNETLTIIHPRQRLLVSASL